MLALAALGTLLPARADWPQFLGPTRNGVSAETGLTTSWPAGRPTVLWQKEVGAGFSGPAVAGGRLVLFHRQGDQEIIECLDARTGKGQWKLDYPTHYQDDFGFDDGPRATPLLAEGRVFTLGAEGTLHCLDLKTGAKRWGRKLEDAYHPPKGFFGVGTSPILEGGLLVVNVGARGAGIVAFEKDTGKEAWRATDDEASYSSPVAATVDGVRHLFFFTRAGLVSLDPRDGSVRFRKLWRSRMNASVNAASPVVVGDRLFVSACYGAGAVLLRVGKDRADELWKGNEILSTHYGTAVCRQGFLYGFDGRQEHVARLRCVELATGKVRWSKDEFGCGSMILADSLLWIVAENGELVVVEAQPDGYREKARAAVLDKPCRAPIALSEGRLYARDEKRLVCLSLTK